MINAKHKSVIKQLNNCKVKPEEGEVFLLNFLAEHLDDSYDIFFQPYLNGDRPDIVVVREGYGVLIIEVKDWCLDHYYLDEKKHWHLWSNKVKIMSPIGQVMKYKNNLFDLHIDGLLEKNISESKYFGVVKCCIYFHNANQHQLDKLINDAYRSEKDKKFIHHIEIIGRDSIAEKSFNQLLYKTKIGIKKQPSELYTTDLHESFMCYLQPPFHALNEGRNIPYTDAQKRLIVSAPKRQKIKGVAGSGKTKVLAARAVNAHKRTRERVLILTFNITLKNYIHDAISDVREDFSWDAFHITNYHEFITSLLLNAGVEMKIPEKFEFWTQQKKKEYFEKEYYSNEKLFEDNKEKIEKYSAIFIDEVQDYHYEWLNIISKYCLHDNGEYVLFGDAKQNIYSLSLDLKDVRTNVLGAWNQFDKTFRLNSRLSEAAIEFQKQRFANKYELDSAMSGQGELPLGDSNLTYLYYDKDHSPIKLAKELLKIIKSLNEHPNDVTFLGWSIDCLRTLDCIYRLTSKEKTNTMFESEELWLLTLLKENKDIVQQVSLFTGKKRVDRKQRTTDIPKIVAFKSILDRFSLSYEEVPRYQYLLSKYDINQSQFEAWYSSHFAPLIEKELSMVSIKKSQDQRNFQNDLEKIRKNKKQHFHANNGTVKFSTIHSFKGWESKTIFLILEAGQTGRAQAIDELIYTGFTRAKENLIIINIGNNDYHPLLSSIFDKDKLVIK